MSRRFLLTVTTLSFLASHGSLQVEGSVAPGPGRLRRRTVSTINNGLAHFENERPEISPSYISPGDIKYGQSPQPLGSDDDNDGSQRRRSLQDEIGLMIMSIPEPSSTSPTRAPWEELPPANPTPTALTDRMLESPTEAPASPTSSSTLSPPSSTPAEANFNDTQFPDTDIDNDIHSHNSSHSESENEPSTQENQSHNLDGSESGSDSESITQNNESHNHNSSNSGISEQAEASTKLVVSSATFSSLFGIALIFVVLFRLIMLFLLIKHRKNNNLMLAQPTVLAILMVAGTFAIGVPYMLGYLRYESEQMCNVFCLLRDPMILTPLTLAGCILCGRVWRIVLLLTPVLAVQEEEGYWGATIKRNIMLALTRLADTYDDFLQGVGWVKHHCCTALSAKATKRDSQRDYNKRRQMMTVAKSIRRTIPLSTLLWLVFLMMIPQLVLQLFNLIIPPMQERLHIETQTIIQVQSDSASILELLQSDAWMSDLHANDVIAPSIQTLVLWTCQTQTGAWPTYVGVVLMLLPYIAAALLAWTSQDDLPTAFNEATPVARSFKVFLGVVVVALPPVLWGSQSKDPDTLVYLTSMLIFGVVMPPCWFIIYPRIWQAVRENAPSKRVVLRQLFDHTETHTHSHKQDDNGKTAKLALTISKMYEEMGMHSKSLDLFDDALAVWQVDPARSNKEQIGGFTRDEINSLSVSDLECIIQLLIAKGRLMGTFKSGESKGAGNAAQAWLDALEIYEVAPARANMKDRGMFFPVFSGLSVFIKGGKIKDDERCTFETNLAKKFIREAKLQGDPVHYSRALALLCEVKSRLGKYKAALDSFDILKKTYHPEEHSAGVCEVYGIDHCAKAFSSSAMWHMELGNMDLALQACDFVLRDFLHVMDPKNVLSNNELLLPILRVFHQVEGKEKQMRDLYQKHVVDNHDKHFVKHGKSSPCGPCLKPLMMLLDIRHDPINFPDFEDAVEWMMEEDGGVVIDFVDSIYTKYCWSPNSVTAELCLRLANQLIARNGDAADTEALVRKGIKLCEKTEKKTKHAEGKVLFSLAYKIHEPLYAELRDLAATHNIEYVSELTLENGNASSGFLDPKNLPKSYTKVSSSSAMSKNSEKSPLVARTSLVNFASGSQSKGSRASDSRSNGSLVSFATGSNSKGSRSRDSSSNGKDALNGKEGRSSMVSRLSDISLDSKFRSRFESATEEGSLLATFPSTEFGEGSKVSDTEPFGEDEGLGENNNHTKVSDGDGPSVHFAEPCAQDDEPLAF